jgi:hypothetical protein
MTGLLVPFIKYHADGSFWAREAVLDSAPFKVTTIKTKVKN